MARLRYNNLSGSASANGLTLADASTTTVTWVSSPGFPTIAAPDTATIVVEPDTANEEIVSLTAYTSGATTGTVTRAQEGTTGRAHAATAWVHGPTAADYAYPILSSGDATFQPGNVVNNALTIHNPASAVNGVQIAGSVTGSAPTVSVVGTDSNIGLAITPKGTGGVTITAQNTAAVPLTVVGASTSQSGDLFDVNQAGTTTVFKVQSGGATSVNGLAVVPGATTVRPALTAFGTDTNIGFTFQAKGTGNIVMVSSANGASASGINITFPSVPANGIGLNCAAASSTPSVAAAGSDTNVDLSITPKGTGVINFAYASVAAAGSTPATLTTATGGATGPSASTQNAWLAVKINGTLSYIPFWR